MFTNSGFVVNRDTAVAAVTIPIGFDNTLPPECVPTNDVTSILIYEHEPLPSYSLSCRDAAKPSIVALNFIGSRRKRQTVSVSRAIQSVLKGRDYNFNIAETKYGELRPQVWALEYSMAANVS